MAWLSGWTYRKRIYLNTTSVSVTDDQVRFLIGESENSVGCDFHLNNHSEQFPSGENDSGDIRITDDNANTIPIYVERVIGTSPNRIAILWCKVPSDLSNPTMLYCFYGNSSASNVSDGSSVFEFFDNFDTDNIDTNYKLKRITDKSTVSASYDNVNKYLVFDTGIDKSSTYIINSLSMENFILELSTSADGAYTNGGNIVMIARYANNKCYYGKIFVDRYDDSGGITNQYTGVSPSFKKSEGVTSLVIFGGVIISDKVDASVNSYILNNTYYKVKLSTYNNDFKLYLGDTEVLSMTDNDLTGSGGIGFGAENYNGFIDTVFVRKNINEDVTINNVGVEESENVVISETITLNDSTIVNKPVTLNDAIVLIDSASGGFKVDVYDNITLNDELLPLYKEIPVLDNIYLNDELAPLYKEIPISDNISVNDNVYVISPPIIYLTGSIDNKRLTSSDGVDTVNSKIHSNHTIGESDGIIFYPMSKDDIVRYVGNTIYEYTVVAVYNRSDNPTVVTMYLEDYEYNTTGFSQKFEMANGSTEYSSNDCVGDVCKIKLIDRHKEPNDTLENDFDTYDNTNPLTFTLSVGCFKLVYIRRVVTIDNTIDCSVTNIEHQLKLHLVY